MVPTPKAARLPQPLDAAKIPTALLKLSTVEAVTGYSKASIYRKVASGEFPQPVKLGARCTRWRAGEVTAWANAQGGAA